MNRLKFPAILKQPELNTRPPEALTEIIFEEAENSDFQHNTDIVRNSQSRELIIGTISDAKTAENTIKPVTLADLAKARNATKHVKKPAVRLSTTIAHTGSLNMLVQSIF